MNCEFLYPNKLSVLCWLQPLASGGSAAFFDGGTGLPAPRRGDLVGSGDGLMELSDNFFLRKQIKIDEMPHDFYKSEDQLPDELL